jgi:hypothetical protein
MLDVEQTSFAFDGVPPYLSNLKELKILDISETYFFGELDGSIFAPLQNLMYLEMGGNIYNSTIPSEIANLPNLEAFYLYDTGLWGDIELVPKMHKIVELWLDQNPDLEGTIPPSIGNLQNLASFSVTHCDLSGQIPTQFGKLSELEQVSVTVVRWRNCFTLLVRLPSRTSWCFLYVRCSKGMVLRQLVFWIHPYGVRCVAQASDLGFGRQQYHQRCHARRSLQEGNGLIECRLRRSRWYGCLRMLHMLHGTLSSGEPSHLRLKSTPSDPGRYSEALT